MLPGKGLKIRFRLSPPLSGTRGHKHCRDLSETSLSRPVQPGGGPSPEWPARGQPALPPAVCASSSGSGRPSGRGRSPLSSPAASSPWTTQAGSQPLCQLELHGHRAVTFTDPTISFLHLPTPLGVSAPLFWGTKPPLPKAQRPRTSQGAPTARSSARAAGEQEEPPQTPHRSRLIKHTPVKMLLETAFFKQLFFKILASLCGTWDLRSRTSDGNCTP